ncbi:DUF6011 domain-containing protein [Frankia sp. Mgl5]|uniref:DUF6011 domain-containing protein n=1 Tax=Frankia sp. Mgl5 TaxID=2933793 RepID=UPI00200C3036|nr:DUF6011 domain-containing protein [Frankia sp. Mgl5]MCK9929344.1 DUF6011 domain-containing protein [Frankia sp. Mgl5]
MTATTAHTTCGRCGRALRTAESVARGFGPTCARKAAIEATHSATQVADAVELVELGGVIPLRGRRVWLTVGHRGEVYRTAVTGQCNCPAGLVGRRCYHAAAVALRVGGRRPVRRVAVPMPTVAYVAAA